MAVAEKKENADADEAGDAEWRAVEAAALAALEAAEAAEAAAAEAEEKRLEEMAARRAKIALLRGCAQAAEAIKAADVLMLCTGAGFSADSGLAVYRDIAKIPAYQQRGLQYHDICDPSWLETDPDLFYGFWGTCFNDYRSTRPHRGYDIIAAWRDQHFRDSSAAREIRQRVLAMESQESEGDSPQAPYKSIPQAPYKCTGHPGAFFVFTSNVDAHSFDHFGSFEVHECHGNTEIWQCAAGDRCCSHVWRAPLDYSFQVDLETMLAPREVAEVPETTAEQKAEESLIRDEGELAMPDSAPEATAQASPKLEEAAVETAMPGGAPESTVEASPELGEAAAETVMSEGAPEATAEASPKLEETSSPGDDEEQAPRAGRVRRGERTQMLRAWPPLEESASYEMTKESFQEPNRPRCTKCGSLARPAILMFGDFNWVEDDAQALRYSRWVKAVETEVKARADLARDSEKVSPLKVCTIEIGCGKNVPTCRMNSSQFEHRMANAGAQAALIRINNDFPGPDVRSMMGGKQVEHFALRGGGLECIILIDAAMADPAAALEAANNMLKELEAEEKMRKEPPRVTEEERLAATALD